MAPNSFRFAALRAFLTYSQVCENVTKETIHYDLADRFRIKNYVFAEETHEDGGRHIHAILVFETKLDSRDSRVFDINCGHNECPDFHPNIKPIERGKTHMNRVLDYVYKEDPAPLSNMEPKLTWGEIIEQSQCTEEYLSLIKHHYPKDFALSLARLKDSAAYLFPRTDANTILENTYRFPLNDLPPAWSAINQRLPEWDPAMRSLVLVGPPGCGKTSWAKNFSKKPCLFVRHLDSLRLFDPTFHKSIIFDDLAFEHLPVQTQKYLTDCTDLAEVHIRYGIGRIPAGTERIFTANEYPFSVGGVHGEAIARRVTLFSLNNI